MRLRAYVYTRKQLVQAAELIGKGVIEAVYAPLRVVDGGSAYSDKIILVPTPYLADCEKSVGDQLRRLQGMGYTKALAHTVGHIELLQNNGFTVYGGSRLNCTNGESLSFFRENGVKDIILSVELTVRRLRRLHENAGDSCTGVMAYGHLPLMLCRRCPAADGKPCARAGKEPCRKQITGRKGEKLDVMCGENCVELLNTDVLWLGDRLNEISGDYAVLFFTFEDDITGIVDAYRNGGKAPEKGFTRGLYFRGVK